MYGDYVQLFPNIILGIQALGLVVEIASVLDVERLERPTARQEADTHPDYLGPLVVMLRHGRLLGLCRSEPF